jgi:IS1 family transposase
MRPIEVDEIWGFIGAKRKNAARAGAYGDVWTFIALDADTKLIPSFIVGKRDAYHARAFMEDLAGRLSRRVQLTSDAMLSYPEAVEKGFGLQPTNSNAAVIAANAMIIFDFMFLPSCGGNSNAICPVRPSQTDFGLAVFHARCERTWLPATVKVSVSRPDR